MSFFDRKEEVLEIELTPYGRYLLSSGEMEPVYYSFFDDDVVYDLNYSGFSEEQNSTEGRIKESLRTHCQADFTGKDRNEYNTLQYDEKGLQHYFEREYALNSELGISDYYSDSAPSWDINVLKGEIAHTALNYTGSGPSYRIPQVKMSDAEYAKVVGNLSVTAGPDVPFDEEQRTIEEYGDGFIEVRQDFILLEINEGNTSFQKENFEIELFRVDEEFSWRSDFPKSASKYNTAELLTPLKFEGPAPPGSPSKVEYVDYFFDVDVDMEIDERVLCKYKGVDTAKGLFSQQLFDCGPDEGAPADQYRTNVRNIGEICEDV